MLALQGLSQFASLVYSPGSASDVTVTLRGRGLSGRGRSFVVNSSNRLLQQTEIGIVLPTSLHYSLSGTGCALIQVRQCQTELEYTQGVHTPLRHPDNLITVY